MFKKQLVTREELYLNFFYIRRVCKKMQVVLLYDIGNTQTIGVFSTVKKAIEALAKVMESPLNSQSKADYCYYYVDVDVPYTKIGVGQADGVFE